MCSTQGTSFRAVKWLSMPPFRQLGSKDQVLASTGHQGIGWRAGPSKSSLPVRRAATYWLQRLRLPGVSGARQKTELLKLSVAEGLTHQGTLPRDLQLDWGSVPGGSGIQPSRREAAGRREVLLSPVTEHTQAEICQWIHLF